MIQKGSLFQNPSSNGYAYMYHQPDIQYHDKIASSWYASLCPIISHPFDHPLGSLCLMSPHFYQYMDTNTPNILVSREINDLQQDNTNKQI